MYSVFYLLLFKIHLMVKAVYEVLEHIFLHIPHSVFLFGILSYLGNP